MPAIRKRIPALALGAFLAAAAGAAEPPAGEPPIEKAQRRALERLIFNCRIKLAGQEEDLAKAKEHLSKAEESAKWFRKRAGEAESEEDKKKLRDLISRLAGQLANSYGQAAERARAAKKADLAGEFRQKNIEWLVGAMKDAPALPEVFLLINIFMELEDYAQARALCRALLDKLDPQGTGRGVPDERLPRFEALREAVRGSPGIDTPEKMKLARQKLTEIEHYMRGRPEEKAGERVIRPAVYKDPHQAFSLTSEFAQQHPGYKLTEEIEKLKKEMLLRARLLRVRTSLTTCCRHLGSKAAGEGRAEEAAKLFSEGATAAGKALEGRPRDAGLRTDYGDCLLGSGDAKKARAEFEKLRRGCRLGGEVWWRASKGLVRSCEAGGDFRAARIALVTTMLHNQKDIAERWPEAPKEAARLAEKMGMTLEEFLGKSAAGP